MTSATSRTAAPDAASVDALNVMQSVTGRTQKVEPPRAETIAAFLSTRPDLGGVLTDLRLDESRRTSGASSGTQVFDMTVRDGFGRDIERRLVFRYDLGGAFFFQYDLPTQFEVMKALRTVGFPCPEPLWLDADGEIAGAPGLFMAFVDAPAPAGQPFAEGPLAEADPSLRHQMILQSVRTLARLHSVSPAELKLDFLGGRGSGGHFIDREIDWTTKELLRALPEGFGGERRAYYNDARAALLAVGDRLLARAPRDRAPEIAHGDANLSNVRSRGSEVVVLLDWELCHIGLGEADLGYCIAGCDHFMHLLPPMSGVPSTDAMAQAYRAARGKLEDWAYCQLLGEWRLAVFQAMAFSRLPAEMAHLEETYWDHSRDRLRQFGSF